MSETKQKNINININDGTAFYANELSVMHNPFQFILDFKVFSPRLDQRVTDEQAIVSLMHNVVLVDPYQAKLFLETFAASVKNYEAQFGKITKPKALEIFEKANPQLKNQSKNKDVPGYFG